MGAVTRDTGNYVTRDTGYQPLTVLGRIVQLCALLHNTQPLRIFSTDHISEPVNIPSVVLEKKYTFICPSHIRLERGPRLKKSTTDDLY